MLIKPLPKLSKLMPYKWYAYIDGTKAKESAVRNIFFKEQDVLNAGIWDDQKQSTKNIDNFYKEKRASLESSKKQTLAIKFAKAILQRRNSGNVDYKSINFEELNDFLSDKYFDYELNELVTLLSPNKHEYDYVECKTVWKEPINALGTVNPSRLEIQTCLGCGRYFQCGVKRYFPKCRKCSIRWWEHWIGLSIYEQIQISKRYALLKVKIYRIANDIERKTPSSLKKLILWPLEDLVLTPLVNLFSLLRRLLFKKRSSWDYKDDL